LLKVYKHTSHSNQNQIKTKEINVRQKVDQHYLPHVTKTKI